MKLVVSYKDQWGSIVDQKYYEIIATLKHWRPPLHLSFIKCPTKSGFLKKFTKDKGRSGSKVWRNRYFSLESGHLQYREKEHTLTKGDIPLMGSSVSILAGPDIGERCCFRILSGVTAIILQAENHEIMMDWVTRLYHAIALANGAKYLPQLQANRAKSLAMQKEVEIATQASLKTATFEKDAQISRKEAHGVHTITVMCERIQIFRRGQFRSRGNS